ncbi:Flp pilus assembly protein TadG [Geodermatophilus normandii]|uniref:Flp pilus assembly protein TadG n=1 Tax=Geodermatophilus normandii TaxID=1137989 RepID=A0A317QQ56_9ACTN|nr:pilus assembly protein TadG-related protein [Geodermatophilus normandii]PWW24846.1 Flp pilus assembly protein TadG [Geodermatophilus normandii]
MQRLIPGLRARVRRRLAGERGAAAVVLSVLLVPLLGFTAIAVDLGALYADRARLQVAADAAALAVARDCARGACGDMQATAQELVDANSVADAGAGAATAAPPLLRSAPTRVTVTGSAPREHWFAPVIGHDASAVSATATVTWGAPSGGTAMLPLIFSWCEWLAQTGGGMPSTTTQRTIVLPKKSDTGCTGPSRMFVPGGFGWLQSDGGNTCRATTRIGSRYDSEPGNNPSQGCSVGDVASLVGRTVLLPIFDESGGTGSGAWYEVHGYAAFTITGYHFGGQYDSGQPCRGEDRCIRGYFTRFVDASGAFDTSTDAPDLGAAILRLIR